MKRRSTVGLVFLAVPLLAWSYSPLASGDPPPALPQPAHDPQPVRARMVSQRAQLQPGQVNLIGISLDVEPGWHVYWDGASDSGMPVAITPTLPPGYKAGELRWPVPKRRVDAGDILDYVYEKRVTLVLPVTVPADAKPGDKVNLNAAVEWFVCKDVCIRGEGRVELSIPVAATGQSEPPLTKDADLFAGPFPKPALPDWIKPAWKGRTLTLPATGPAADGITRMSFYAARTCAPLSDAVHQGESAGTSLTLDIKPAGAGPSPRVRGVLEVVRAGAKPAESFTVDIPVPEGTGS